MADIDAQAIESRTRGQDIALCSLLETLARLQPALARAVAVDIRSKAEQLQNSRTAIATQTNSRAVAYAEIIERIIRENRGAQNAELNALRNQPH